MSDKHFTYKVYVSFEMQFTFSGSEVEQSDEGDSGDMSPKDDVLTALGKEIEEHLSQEYGGVFAMKVHTDFDELLGVTED